METINALGFTIHQIVYDSNSYWSFFIYFFLFVLFIEMPLYTLISLGVIYKYLKQAFSPTFSPPYYPSVSCIVACYSEGNEVVKTVRSLEHQVYRGKIEILMMVDGSEKNKHTLKAIQNYKKKFRSSPKRVLRVISKVLRGGRASSMNLGKELSSGDIVIALDGDCSCDNDMIGNITKKFYDENVIACAGTLRVRNAKKSLITRLQTLEYLLGIQFSKIGLTELNYINNFSGAFSCFRSSFISKTSGWRNGSAEDLDMTLRVLTYLKTNKNLKIKHSPVAITHTDVPETAMELFKQRLRWDGDLLYVYFSKYKKRLSPKYMGWKNFIMLIWSGVIMNAILPVVIIMNITYLLIAKPFIVFLAVMTITYVYYLIINLFMFVLNLVFVSERKKYDLQFMPFLLVMPFYTIMTKFFTTVGLICEVLIKSHRDSSMAPPWVNRKVK